MKSTVNGVHLVVGGYPPGSPAAHDMDYVRLRLLDELAALDGVHTTVSSDYADLDRWLPPARLLVTYVAGPVPPTRTTPISRRGWRPEVAGWRCTARAAARRPGSNADGRRGADDGARGPTTGRWVRSSSTIRRCGASPWRSAEHPLTAGLPDAFDAVDELYLIELQDRDDTEVLLTTELDADPSPPGFGFVYDADTSALDERGTRALGYVHHVGDGAVAYVALGHCHSPSTNTQPFVDPPSAPDGTTPLTFRGMWETPPFMQIVRNGIAWGLADR